MKPQKKRFFLRVLIPILAAIALASAFAAGTQPSGPKSLGSVAPASRLRVDLVETMELSPDRKHIVCSGSSDIVKYSVPDGALTQSYRCKAPSPLNSAVFSLDGKKVIAIQPGVHVWDEKSGDVLLSSRWEWMEKPHDPRTPDPLKPSIHPVIDPARTKGFVAGPGKHVTSWSLENGKEIGKSIEFAERVYSMAVSADGKQVAVGFRGGFKVLDSQSLKVLFDRALSDEGHVAEGSGYRVSFHPKIEQILYTIGKSGPKRRTEVLYWDTAKKESVGSIAILDGLYERIVVLPDHQHALVTDRVGKNAIVVQLDKGRMLGTMRFTGSCQPFLLLNKDTFVSGSGRSLAITKLNSVLDLIPEN